MSNQLMALKDLRVSLGKHKHETVHAATIDSSVACQIVDIMFDQISRCLQQDRSRVKVNGLAKGVVLGLLGDRTKNGMKQYLENMFSDDIKELLDDIQQELDKRDNFKKL